MTPTQEIIAAILEHVRGYPKKDITIEMIDAHKGYGLWKAIDKIVLPMQQKIDRLNLENDAQAAD